MAGQLGLMETIRIRRRGGGPPVRVTSAPITSKQIRAGNPSITETDISRSAFTSKHARVGNPSITETAFQYLASTQRNVRVGNTNAPHSITVTFVAEKEP